MRMNPADSFLNAARAAFIIPSGREGQSGPGSEGVRGSGL